MTAFSLRQPPALPWPSDSHYTTLEDCPLHHYRPMPGDVYDPLPLMACRSIGMKALPLILGVLACASPVYSRDDCSMSCHPMPAVDGGRSGPSLLNSYYRAGNCMVTLVYKAISHFAFVFLGLMGAHFFCPGVQLLCWFIFGPC